MLFIAHCGLVAGLFFLFAIAAFFLQSPIVGVLWIICALLVVIIAFLYSLARPQS